jgi:hypothetical protein
MNSRDGTDCHEFLMDLICYEIRSRHLSPEMTYLLDEHLERCASCRQKIMDFWRVESPGLVSMWGELLN